MAVTLDRVQQSWVLGRDVAVAQAHHQPAWRQRSNHLERPNARIARDSAHSAVRTLGLKLVLNGADGARSP
jgi:hypothetical protein